MSFIGMFGLDGCFVSDLWACQEGTSAIILSRAPGWGQGVNRAQKAGIVPPGSERPGGSFEPGPGFGIERRSDRLPDTGVIGIQPGPFLLRQQLDRDQPAVDRGQRQGLEGQHLAFAALDLGRRDGDQILDADAVGAGLVVAWLVGDHHTGLQCHLALHL